MISGMSLHFSKESFIFDFSPVTPLIWIAPSSTFGHQYRSHALEEADIDLP